MITFCCCPSTPVAKYVVTEEPVKEDIIGTYEFSTQKVIDDDIQISPESKIEILADGTCTLTDFPVFVEDGAYGSPYKFKESFTSICQWKVKNIGSVRLDRETFPIWGVCFNAVNFDSAMKCAHLTNVGNPYELVFVFGDPDSNDILVFEKPSSE